jgi:glycosyltransferase involved in cell wall biosynthesis
MFVLIDAVGIRGHGGAAVLCELLHWLPQARPTWRWQVLLLERQLREFDDPPVCGQVALESTSRGNSGWERMRWVQRELPDRVRAVRPDVLFSFANIAPPRSICPQVVFCHQRNALFDDTMPWWAVVRRARMRMMRRQIFRGARASQAIIVQTAAMQQRFVELAPDLANRVCVIPSGFRTASSAPTVRPEKKQLIDNSAHPRLIYVSHPSEHKNHLALIKALPAILAVFPATRLLLTLERDNPPNKRFAQFVHAIAQAADRLGVADHLVWLGRLEPDEISYALEQSDLTVFPSLAESFGLGLAEAMAAGCPVAAADLPYAHDVGGDAAIYFDPCDPASIGRDVAAVLSDKDRLGRLRKAGQDRKHLYRYERIAAAFATVFETAAAGDGN